MTTIFRTVLNMSITGSWVILAVILVRMLLKKAPRKYSLALWAAAAFRLCCPVSFESILSIFRLPLFDMTAAQAPVPGQLTYISADAAPHVTTGVVAMNSYLPPVVTPSPAPAVTVDWVAVGSWIWCAGMAGMILWSLGSWWLLQRRVDTAIRVEENVYRSDTVESPFILGLFRPRIYLPSTLNGKEQEFVLAHERTHLQMGDHILKLLAYGILALHWFNPLCHLAFRLLSRDLEMRCDEAVLARQPEIRKAYSAALVSLAVQPGLNPASPLAFGETAVRDRVKHILKWKKPALWITIAATLVSGLCLVSCAANPIQIKPTENNPGHTGSGVLGQTYRPYQLITTNPAASATWHYLTSNKPWYQISEEGVLLQTGVDGWEEIGLLEEFDLTPENFDECFTHFFCVNDYYASGYSPADLRKQVTRAWKASIPAGVSHSPNAVYRYYVLQTEQNHIYLVTIFTYATTPSAGYVVEMYRMIPYSGVTNAVVLEDGSYVSSRHIYQSPVMSSFMNHDSGAVYTVADGLFTVSLRPSNSVIDSYIISDRCWEPFPFTQEEWDQMTPGIAETGITFRDTQYLDISPHYWLLKTDMEILLCQVHYYPSGAPYLQNIYALTTLGSKDDTWVIRFDEIENLIQTIASGSGSAEECIQRYRNEYLSLTGYPDSYLVLRYCYERFYIGGETGKEGSIMATVSRDILTAHGEETLANHDCTNGQEWFDAFWKSVLNADRGWSTFGGKILLDVITALHIPT